MQLRGRRGVVGLGALVLPLVLTGCITVNVQAPSGSPSASPSVSSSSASPTPSSSTSTPGYPALGPNGFGALLLGLNKTQASATGLVTGVTGTRGTCGQSKDGRLTGADPVDNDDLAGKLFFSVNTGRLVIIGAMPGVATPEGIALGSTTAEVRAAYPSWKGYRKDNYGVGYVKAPGNAKAYYRIYVHDDEVVELTIQSLDQDCTE